MGHMNTSPRKPQREHRIPIIVRRASRNKDPPHTSMMTMCNPHDSHTHPHSLKLLDLVIIAELLVGLEEFPEPNTTNNCHFISVATADSAGG